MNPRDAVRWAIEEKAEVFIVDTEDQVRSFTEAAEALGAKMTIRLRKPGMCFVCHEYHRDMESDCRPPNDYSSRMRKIVALSK